jgi:hypothetical protein
LGEVYRAVDFRLQQFGLIVDSCDFLSVLRFFVSKVIIVGFLQPKFAFVLGRCNLKA